MKKSIKERKAELIMDLKEIESMIKELPGHKTEKKQMGQIMKIAKTIQ